MAAGAIRVPLSGNPTIDALLSQFRADAATLTYGFPTAASVWDFYQPGSEPFTGFTPLNLGQQGAVTQALAAWASVANVGLTLVSEPGQTADLRFAGTGVTRTAHTYYPHWSPVGGDSWYGASMMFAPMWLPGTYEYQTVLHEVGHALGLKHPHDNRIGGIVGDESLSLETTVMSYRSTPGEPIQPTYSLAPASYPTTPMVEDIAAIQYLYGANYATNAGDSVYQFVPGQRVIFQTVWDGGGNDTYDFSAFADDAAISLEPGQWSRASEAQLARLNAGDPSVLARGNVANAHLYGDDPRSLIENAMAGSGNDSIVGNRANNGLLGNAGDDTLRGGAGDDVLYAGADADQLWGGDGNDVLSGDGGLDWLIGGPGADIFHLTADSGHDIAFDFSYAEGDRIRIDGGPHTVAAGMAGAVVGFAGGSLTLAGIDASTIDGTWFMPSTVA